MFGNTQERLDKVHAQWISLSWEETAAFIGPNSESFRKVWEKMREAAIQRKPRVVWSWSWPAFLLFPAWFCYRRMWVLGLPLMLFLLAFSILTDGESAGGGIGTAIVLTAMSRQVYLTHAATKIWQLKNNGEASLDRIAAAGGTSKGGAIVATVWALLGIAAVVLSYKGA